MCIFNIPPFSQKSRAQSEPDRFDRAAEVDLVLDRQWREDVPGEGHAGGELPELHSHPRQDGREHVACVRD